MKKVLVIILFLFSVMFFVKIKAYEITYSDWSTTYPDGYDEMFIESEERYLWYKEVRVNEEYLRGDQVGDKEIDYNDYIYTQESEHSPVKPIKYPDRIIHEYRVPSSYPENSIKKLVLDDHDFYDDVLISEISVTDRFSGEKIKASSSLEFLIDGDLENYTKINNGSEVKIVFDDFVSFDSIEIIIYYQSVSNKSSFVFNLLSEDEKRLYSGKYMLDGDEIYVYETDLKKSFDRMIIEYTYVDKLYKTYEIDRIVTDDYYSEYEGYLRDDSSLTMYYRYITNKAVLVDGYGDLVTDSNYCIKEDCYVLYVVKEEVETPEEPENPETIDNIYMYVALLIISLIVLTIIFRRKIYLVLSNLFKLRK